MLEVVLFSLSAIVSYSDQVAWDRKAMEKCDTHERIENDDRYTTIPREEKEEE